MLIRNRELLETDLMREEHLLEKKGHDKLFTHAIVSIGNLEQIK